MLADKFDSGQAPTALLIAPHSFSKVPAAQGLLRLFDSKAGRKSIDTLRGYVRDAELFKDHAGAGLL
jgi:hypothetical protein